jgi:predicted Mrr-cat superfamily restriction endonuclease
MGNVWKIAPGEHAEDWEVFRRQGCIGLGWLTGSDYQSFRSEAEVLRALEHQHGKNSPGNGRGAAKMIWSFVQEVKRSDAVVANDRYNRVVGIGVVRALTSATGGHPRQATGDAVGYSFSLNADAAAST